MHAATTLRESLVLPAAPSNTTSTPLPPACVEEVIREVAKLAAFVRLVEPPWLDLRIQAADESIVARWRVPPSYCDDLGMKRFAAFESATSLIAAAAAVGARSTLPASGFLTREQLQNFPECLLRAGSATTSRRTALVRKYRELSANAREGLQSECGVARDLGALLMNDEAARLVLRETFIATRRQSIAIDGSALRRFALQVIDETLLRTRAALGLPLPRSFQERSRYAC